MNNPTTSASKSNQILRTSTNSIIMEASVVAKKRQRFSLQSGDCPKQEHVPQHESQSLAAAETRTVKFLRATVVIVLLVSAAVVSGGVYQVMRQEEHEDFTHNFQENALQLVEAFHEGLEQNLGAVASMSTAITSYANNGNMTFPFVLLPDFELRGANVRIQSGSNVVVYAPLVTEDLRTEWEDYALKHRSHIDQAYELDTQYRLEQDQQLAEAELEKAQNQHDGQRRDQEQSVTILEDGTGYHPKIFGDDHDEPLGSGPYLPVWQRSPIEDSRQASLNYNVAPAHQLIPDLDDFLYHEKKAIFNAASSPSSTEGSKQWIEDVLMISQFRHKPGKYANDLHSYLVYPVFDSFADNDQRQVVGILITDIFWRFLFRHLLPQTAQGIVCVIENNFDQVFSYRIDGPDVTFLGMGDAHDTKYDDQEVSQDVISYIQDHVGAHNRAYKTVGLSNVTQYKIRVFPSRDTEKRYVSYKPMIYALVLVGVFTFACALLISYSCVVEKRQVIMMEKVLENARRAAQVERDLNEFLAHEVRNPLSAAIAASTFVSSAVKEAEPLMDPETRRHVREDIDVVNASLGFINDFLRSMLDIYKATGDRITVEMRPADLKRDIFEPVAHILNKRTASFQVLVDCPDNMVVLTDSIRLKQVILNLIRNASMFVLKGFIRMRVELVDHQVVLYVEDSGPGVAPEKRGELFSKYQQSLDLLSQGTGIGLNLSKKLMEIMGGDLYLDETYHSGVQGCPGARFVIQLNTAPLDIESAVPAAAFNDGTQSTVDIDQSGRSHEFSARRRQQREEGANEIVDISPPMSQENLLVGSEKPHQELPPLPPPPPELPKDLSCLFVDDDKMLRKLFMRAVKKVAPSWRIQEAGSGEEAIQICEEQNSSSPFNLIFMDQYMASTEKKLLGTETVQAMRQKGIDSKICGLSANDVRALFLQAGSDAFLLKPMPCKPDDLKAALLQILDIKQTQP